MTEQSFFDVPGSVGSSGGAFIDRSDIVTLLRGILDRVPAFVVGAEWTAAEGMNHRNGSLGMVIHG